MAQDNQSHLLEQVEQAIGRKQAISIHGSGSHDKTQPEFAEPDRLDMTQHTGIIDYQPTELTLRARAGTPLSDIREALSEQQQRLPTDFPQSKPDATLGGAIAIGHTGSARPFHGALRDHVLGTTLIDGFGKVLECGGQVMKNVAGYDVSRLLCGSRGTLGPILDITIKVLPAPEVKQTLVLNMPEDQAIDTINKMAGQSLPISAAAWYQSQLYLRIEGTESGCHAARLSIGGEVIGNDIWEKINSQQHAIFAKPDSLWRCIVPTTMAPIGLNRIDDQLIDWCGGLRWIQTREFDQNQFLSISEQGGFISRFQQQENRDIFSVIEQISPLARKMNAQVKQAFDPHRLFNPRLHRYFFDQQQIQ